PMIGLCERGKRLPLSANAAADTDICRQEHLCYCGRQFNTGAHSMRKSVVGEFVSADGVMDSPETCQFPFQTDELGAITERQIREADAFLLGRVTYEMFPGYWPTLTHNEFGVADKLNSAPKYVVSTTLQKADWNNS